MCVNLERIDHHGQILFGYETCKGPLYEGKKLGCLGQVPGTDT